MAPVRFLLWSSLAAAALLGQCPPGAPMPSELVTQSGTPAPQGPADVRWQLARQALDGKRFDEARQHLLAALEFHPASPPLLLDMLRTAADDADLRALWGERFVRAAADAQGRLKLDPALKKAVPTGKDWDPVLAEAQKLAALRAQAALEVQRLAERHKAQPKASNLVRSVMVRWCAELLLTLGERAPATLAGPATALDGLAAGFQAEPQLVAAGLLRVLRAAARPAGDGPTTGPTPAELQDRAVRAARILLGLQRQAGFKDLQGPPPADLSAAATEARQWLDASIEAARATAKVWTVEELAAMSPEAAEQFTRAHAHWHTPGIALSPTGKYRIETVCGHGTLLGTARTVEHHHARLVGHYGQDPFADRPGLVRIVPENHDLETEGAPYWWAGGFQAGDRTTLRFAWGTIPALGRGLTHELTHRFDGVLRPFLGSWFTEGHASWTGGHYARTTDTEFVERHLDFGAVIQTSNKGYGNRENFEKLLRSAVEEYRDNYFAGYTLYAFLRSYPPGAPRYRDALERFEKNARGGQKDPVGYFTTSFADGKQGRPAGFEAFLADWQGFLRGVAQWFDDKRQGNEWVGKYPGLGETEGGPQVLDAPTWSWARQRAEPFFGQDHAAEATRLLHEVGDHEATLAAGLWSLTVDGWRPGTAKAVLDALTARAPEAAHAFGAVAALRLPELPVPTAPGLWNQVKACRSYLDALAARCGDGTSVAGAAMAAEHVALARRLGAPLDRLAPAAAAPPPPPVHIGGHGFSESGLTGFEDRRVRGLWYATAEGDLHVGRERPREATGTMDRAAHQRDAFVHTAAWLDPGDYVLRGRVHFTTAFTSGTIVFGHSRRDRDLRLSFSAGDFRYAIGKEERDRHSGQVHFRLHGLWERDGQLPETGAGFDVDLGKEQNWFDYTLTVRGARVLVEIDGEPRLRYAVHDGAPIEGHVGFAMSMGAIRVQGPTVQRLDPTRGPTFAGLDPQRPPNAPLDELLLLPTTGFPLGPTGSLVLWLPKVADGSPVDGLGRALPALAKMLQTPHEFPQTWVLAVPRSLSAAERATAAERLREFRAEPLPVVDHDIGQPLVGDYPFVLFLDDRGVLRAAAEVGDSKLHTRVLGWARKFRGR